MRVVFTIAGLSPEFGGPSRSVPALAVALAAAGVEVEILTCEGGPGRGSPLLPSGDRIHSRLLPQRCRQTAGWLPGRNPFAAALRESCRAAGDVVIHDNGVWLPTNHATAGVARELELPLLISPRGMLSAWAIQFRGIKKRVAWWLYQRRDLRSARLLHATSRDEAEDFRALGMCQPIAIIPNGVELPSPLRLDRGEGQGEVSNPSSPSQLRTALFLSRIHPKKGLLDLVEAWARVRPAGWRMVIAGGDEGGHRAVVEAAIRGQHLESQFTFAGELADTDKWDYYRSADLFVLPTKSENFGIVIAEALACGVPVLTTKGAPWGELETHRCGWWVDLGVEPLAIALRAAVQVNDEQRREMGRRGMKLIAANYSWTVVAQQMVAVYAWLLGHGNRPACVTAANGR